MVRVKHVFDTDDEIRDLWIAGELDWARQRNRTSSFRGPHFYRKLGGDAVRFAAPDGTTFYIGDRNWGMPDGWRQIALPLYGKLLDAGIALASGPNREALETVRVALEKAMERAAEESRAGKSFSQAQATRFAALSDLHAVRAELSSIYKLRWSPLFDQAWADALSGYVGRGAKHASDIRYRKQDRVWRTHRERMAADAANPVDDLTSVAEWKAGARVHVNPDVRSGSRTYLRLRDGTVELSHGLSWSPAEFHRIARLLIRTLRQDIYWGRAALAAETGSASVEDVDDRGIRFRVIGRQPALPVPPAEIAEILQVTAPRLAASLMAAKAEHEARHEEARDLLADMARGAAR